MQAEYLQHTRQAADRAGQHHGPEHQLFGRNAAVGREAVIIAGQLHFEAHGRAGHQIPREQRRHRRKQDGRGQVAQGDQLGKARFLHNAGRAGGNALFRGFQGAVGHVAAKEGRHAVEHDGGDDLVHLPIDLHRAGNPCIQSPRQQGSQQCQNDHDPRGHALYLRAHHSGGQRAHEKLPFAAHVENTRFGRHAHGKAAQRQRRSLGQRIADGTGLTQRTLKQRAIALDGVEAAQKHDARPHQKGQQHRAQQGDQIVPVQLLRRFQAQQRPNALEKAVTHAAIPPLPRFPRPSHRRSCNSRSPPG